MFRADKVDRCRSKAGQPEEGLHDQHRQQKLPSPRTPAIALADGGLSQQGHHAAVPAGLRELERRRSVAVRDPGVGASLEEGPHGFGVTSPAVPEDHRLDQGGPTKVVDVVERCAGPDEFADNAVVAEMGRSDEGRAVVDAGDQLALAPDASRAFSVGTSSLTAAMVTAS